MSAATNAATETLNIEIADEGNQARVELVRSFTDYMGTSMPSHIRDAIAALWQDPGVQACFARADEFRLPDNAPRFLLALDRILADTYVPTVDDGLQPPPQRRCSHRQCCCRACAPQALRW